jgi:hypothetical protein
VPLSALEVASLDQLRRIEPEAVRRLNDSPKSAELFLFDPVGALASVGIVVTTDLVREWGNLIGGALPTLPTQARDLIVRSTGTLNSTNLNMKVVIRGILPPIASSAREG